MLDRFFGARLMLDQMRRPTRLAVKSPGLDPLAALRSHAAVSLRGQKLFARERYARSLQREPRLASERVWLDRWPCATRELRGNRVRARCCRAGARRELLKPFLRVSPVSDYQKRKRPPGGNSCRVQEIVGDRSRQQT